MEQAYAGAASAISRLVSPDMEISSHAENEVALRGVLRRRPVAFGFVVSTLARKLTGDKTHAGVRSALEALLASYDPGAPRSVAAILQVLGGAGLQVHLVPAGREDLLLSWPARLCLLHACLKTGMAEGKAWAWIPSAADAVCAAGLQALTIQSKAGVVGKGKGRARIELSGGQGLPEPFSEPEVAGLFSKAVLGDVCAEFTNGSAVLGGYAGDVLDCLPTSSLFPLTEESCPIEECLVQSRGREWLRAFRFKAQALGEALLGAVEVGEPPTKPPRDALPCFDDGEAIDDGGRVRMTAVYRALERMNVSDAFLYGVKTALEAELAEVSRPETSTPEVQRCEGLVVLSHALDTCLFGAGVSKEEDQGRSAALGNSSSIREIRPAATTSSDRTLSAPWLMSAHVKTRPACEFLQNLALEGIRKRDLFLALLKLYQRHAVQYTGAAGLALPQTGMVLVASMGTRSEELRAEVAEVIVAFADRLVGAALATERLENPHLAEWEGDTAAAAAAVAALGDIPTPASRSVCALCPAEARADFPSEAKADIGDMQSPCTVALNRGVDSTDQLDRLLGAAATTAGCAREGLGWADVLRRMTAAVGSAPFSAYAAACVERSVALGGQMPFRLPGRAQMPQAQGGALWHVLEQSRLAGRGVADGAEGPALMLVRTSAAAVASCRRLSCSWMVAPGLLSAGPIRVVVDIIRAAEGVVTISQVLDGLMTRLPEDGPALAADLLAAVFVEEANVGTRQDNGNARSDDLRSKAVLWLGSALAASSPHAQLSDATLSMEAPTAAAGLAQAISRRLPYKPKSVVRAMEEALELAVAKATTWRSSTPCTDPGRGGSLRGDFLASLAEVARGAAQSRLHPLPVPLTHPLPRAERDGRDGGLASKRPPTTGSRRKPIGDCKGSPDEAASTGTALMLLDAFVQAPETVRRILNGAVQRKECQVELLGVQRALRSALCAAPAPAERQRQITSKSGPDTTIKALRAGVSSARAAACLLMCHLVDCGAPGWQETKAALTPPPRDFVDMINTPSGREGCANTAQRDSGHRLSALRLELWLRSICDASPRHDGLDPRPTILVPDVTRTARTLARAIPNQVRSFFVVDEDRIMTYSTDYGGRFFREYGFSSGQPSRNVNGDAGDDFRGVNCSCGDEADKGLEPPRQALMSRYQDARGAGPLASWLPGVLQTVKQYQSWLPWRCFANELRHMLEESLRQPGKSDGGVSSDRSVAATAAAAFASCELLHGWAKAEEVSAAVFAPSLSSLTMSAADIPVQNRVSCCPPMWLAVLRCLVDDGKCDLSQWAGLHDGERSRDGDLAVCAAAALWIGGGGSGAGQSTRHAAWVCWYGAKLGPLAPTRREERIERYLTIAPVEDGAVYTVEVRSGDASDVHTIRRGEWEDWGRSPVESAWNFPGSSAVSRMCSSDSLAKAPAIVLPVFATWLRIVLNSGSCCPTGLLQGYLRRMAREVYLPCEFRGASGDMARQWLAALIDAEAEAQGKVPTESRVANESSSSRAPITSDAQAAARRLAVREFFREELLRFGSGEAPAAPIGGPLTWLWPLEAIVTACGRSGPLGGSMLGRKRGQQAAAVVAQANACVDDLSSALARVLDAVPNDLLCGARRFRACSGRPPPATLRAFATRAVDLAARALAAPTCRAWPVAQPLLLALGLLYHAVARPEPSGSSGSVRTARDLAPSMYMDTTAGARRASEEGLAAQAAALSTVERLIRTALGIDGRVQKASTDEYPVKARSGFGMRSPMLPSSCRSLQPLETCGPAVLQDLVEALRGVGAWRAVRVFTNEADVERGTHAEASALPRERAASSPHDSSFERAQLPELHMGSQPVPSPATRREDRSAAVEKRSLPGPPKNRPEPQAPACIPHTIKRPCRRETLPATGDWVASGKGSSCGRVLRSERSKR